MSFTIQITILSSTRVLLKSENSQKTLRLQNRVRRVKKAGLSRLEGGSATANPKQKKKKKNLSRSNQFHKSRKQAVFLVLTSTISIVQFQTYMSMRGTKDPGVLKKEACRKIFSNPATRNMLSRRKNQRESVHLLSTKICTVFVSNIAKSSVLLSYCANCSVTSFLLGGNRNPLLKI